MSFVLILQVLLMRKEIDPMELDFLLRFPSQQNVTSPVDFIPNQAWGAIKVSDITCTVSVGVQSCTLPYSVGKNRTPL